MDRSRDLTPVQFTLRVASVLATAVGALAFIVISFISSTWEFIPASEQRYAFVVVNASGAHFVLSFAFCLPAILLAHFSGRWSVAIAECLGGVAYIYCALLLQHRGLANTLLPDPWVSTFPFASEIFSYAGGEQSPAAFYQLPLLAAWGVALPVGVACSIFERRKSKIKAGPTQTAAPTDSTV